MIDRSIRVKNQEKMMGVRRSFLWNEVFFLGDNSNCIGLFSAV